MLDAKRAAVWWRRLQPDKARGYPGDPGTLARLRRAPTVAAAMLVPETVRLMWEADGTGWRDLPAAGLVAGVLAHVRRDDPDNPRVARRIGPTNPDKPETALVSQVRFERLFQATEPDERLVTWRRIVPLADNKLNVADLAAALLDWSDTRQQQWLAEYWSGEYEPTPSTGDAA